MNKLIINTDGGSRNNPGLAAASFIVIREDGKVLLEDGKFLGIATNNEAEYSAVKLALEALIKDHGHLLPASIEFRADSLLVVSQLSGVYKIKNERLKEIFSQIKSMESSVGSVTYTYIPREKNKEADALVNKVLDEHSRE